ncbi:MAG: hypothetical protein WC975_05465 [Phycisphaerae bacterium]
MKRLIWVVAAGMILPSLVSASQVSDAQNKLLAKRAAEADCYRKLAERIMGLRINSQTLVRDFVAESDSIQTDLNTFIKGVRLGPPRYYSDGTCEVTGEITYKKVIATISEIHSRHYVDDHIKASDFTDMATRTEISVIKATGSGVPRPDAPLDQPDGTVTQSAVEDLPTPHVPGYWAKHVSPRGRLMAVRAATLDAYRRLGEQLRGFRISSQTSVRDFVAESDEIRTELDVVLRGAHEVCTYFHSDEPIVEVTVEIPWQKVIATIRNSYTTHIKNNHVKESVFNELSTRVEKKYFRATGMGIPPERYLISSGQDKTSTPEWMRKPLSAEGEAAIDNKGNNLAQAKLMAARAAELDAKAKLARIIGGLRLDGDSTIGSFIVKHDQIKAELDAVVDGAYQKGKPEYMENTVRVTVELPAVRVWKVICDEMNVKQEQ